LSVYANYANYDTQRFSKSKTQAKNVRFDDKIEDKEKTGRCMHEDCGKPIYPKFETCFIHGRPKRPRRRPNQTKTLQADLKSSQDVVKKVNAEKEKLRQKVEAEKWKSASSEKLLANVLSTMASSGGVGTRQAALEGAATP
jgi:hypothetical protein